MEAEKARRVVRLISSTIVAILAVAILSAVVMPGGDLLMVDGDPLSVEQDGSDIRISGSYDIRSKLPYAISDLSISVRLADDAHGSTLILWQADGMEIPARGSTRIDIDTGIFSPILAIFASDLLSDEDPTPVLRVDSSFRYIMRTVDVSISADVSLPLSEPGTKLERSTERTDSSIRIDIRNLSEKLVPEDASYVAIGGGGSVAIDVRTSGPTTSLTVSSDGDVSGALQRIRESGDPCILDSDGTSIGLSPEAVRMLIVASERIRWTGGACIVRPYRPRSVQQGSSSSPSWLSSAPSTSWSRSRRPFPMRTWATLVASRPGRRSTSRL